MALRDTKRKQYGPLGDIQKHLSLHSGQNGSVCCLWPLLNVGLIVEETVSGFTLAPCR